MKVRKTTLQELIEECILLELDAYSNIPPELERTATQVAKKASSLVFTSVFDVRRENDGYGIVFVYDWADEKQKSKPLNQQPLRYDFYMNGKLVRVPGQKNLKGHIHDKQNKEILQTFRQKVYDHIVNSNLKQHHKLAKLPMGPMGKVLFGPARNFPEPNTRQEDALFDALRAHVNANKPMSPKYIDVIKNLLAKGLYDDLIVPPQKKNIYRGMALPGRQFIKFIGKTLDELPKKGSIKFKKPFVFNPKTANAGSSWTANLRITKEFQETDQVEILMIADAADNEGKFFDLKKYYEQVDPYFRKEQEIIGLGPIKVKEIRYKIKPNW